MQNVEWEGPSGESQSRTTSQKDNSVMVLVFLARRLHF